MTRRDFIKTALIAGTRLFVGGLVIKETILTTTKPILTSELITQNILSCKHTMLAGDFDGDVINYQNTKGGIISYRNPSLDLNNNENEKHEILI